MLNIAVIGVGGVGGYVGTKLAKRFSTGEEAGIYFIARGRHLEVIREKGLTLKSADAGKSGRITCRPVDATDQISKLPEIDIFIIAVKGYNLDNVAGELKGAVHNDTVILPLLNGADIYERLREEITGGIILPGCIYISSHISEPGVIEHTSKIAKIIFGRDPEHSEFIPENLIRIFSEASIDYDFKDDASEAIWTKYIFIASFALISACYNKTIGEILEDGVLKERVIGIMEEIYLIAERKGIGLPDNIIEDTLKKASTFDYHTQTSLQRDISQNKRKNELDIFGGTIIRLGERLGINTPITAEIYRRLKVDR